MCDLFAASSQSQQVLPASASAIASNNTTTNAMPMPDMDALLDQLEQEELEKQQQHILEKQNVDLIESNRDNLLRNLETNEQAKISPSEEKLLIDLFAESINLNIAAAEITLQEKNESSLDTEFSMSNHQSAIAMTTAATVKATPTVEEQEKKEGETKSEEPTEEEDIFDQIDKMDAFIRTEEQEQMSFVNEAAVAATSAAATTIDGLENPTIDEHPNEMASQLRMNLPMENEVEILKDDDEKADEENKEVEKVQTEEAPPTATKRMTIEEKSIELPTFHLIPPSPLPPSTPTPPQSEPVLVDNFVDEMVDRLLGQAMAESHATAASIMNKYYYNDEADNGEGQNGSHPIQADNGNGMNEQRTNDDDYYAFGPTEKTTKEEAICSKIVQEEDDDKTETNDQEERSHQNVKMMRPIDEHQQKDEQKQMEIGEISREDDYDSPQPKDTKMTPTTKIIPQTTDTEMEATPSPNSNFAPSLKRMEGMGMQMVRAINVEEGHNEEEEEKIGNGSISVEDEEPTSRIADGVKTIEGSSNGKNQQMKTEDLGIHPPPITPMRVGEEEVEENYADTSKAAAPSIFADNDDDGVVSPSSIQTDLVEKAEEKVGTMEDDDETMMQMLETELAEEELREQQQQKCQEDHKNGVMDDASGTGKMPMPASTLSVQPSSSSAAAAYSSPSASPNPHRPVQKPALTIVHDLSVALDEFKLTESELLLGKRKPFWIPDEDCPSCMLCSTRFSLVNRRHHCRACGRVLCRLCCSQRRQLSCMEEREGKQRVCAPCNRTLDRIEEYEQRMAITNSSLALGLTAAGGNSELQQHARSNAFGGENSTNLNGDVFTAESEGATNNQRHDFEGTVRKTKSLLKPPRLSSSTSSTVNSNFSSGLSKIGIGNDELLASTQNGEHGNSNNQTGNDHGKEDQGEQNAGEEQHERRKRPNLIDERMIGVGELAERNQEMDGTVADAANAKKLHLLIARDEPQRLLSTSSTMSTTSTASRRQVTFRDGVNPGQETPTPIGHNHPPIGSAMASSSTGGGGEESATDTSTPTLSSSPYQWLISSSHRNKVLGQGQPHERHHHHHGGGGGQNDEGSNGKKLPKKVSRRTKERRIQEEQATLLQLDHWRVCVLVEDTGEQQRLGGELQPRPLDQAVADLLPENGTSSSICIAIRRNFHVHVEWRKQFFLNQQPVELLSFSTRGMSAIGADELMLVLQLDRNRFTIPEEIEAEFFCALEQFEHLFLNCINPFEESMDHRMGIRKCGNRMARLYHPLAKRRRTLMGHPAGAIYFHRPQSMHNFADLKIPSGPFLVGTLMLEEELPWAKCVPSRLLLRLGQHTGQYPTPLVNLLREKPVFTRDAVQSSVLKVLNDFRGWTYQMVQLSGSAIAVANNSTKVWLPGMALDEVRALVESNRNMIGWAIGELAPAEVELEVDSHLVCEQTDEGHFCTRIFAQDQEGNRKVTGTSFVIFDGALKGGEQFLVTVVEDGLVIRLHSDLMEELVKALLAGDSFTATNSQGHQLSVQFQPQKQPPTLALASEQQQQHRQNPPGALVSPIDGFALDGQFQYGLQLNRQLNSFNFFQYSSEWALRLASVINIFPGKWPSALQPRFFDVCEQLAQQVANTVEPFLQELISASQLSISLRVYVEEDTVSYDTEKWSALSDQHFVWTVTLDEQIIPFLYSLCAWVPSGFHVELHMPILSIRPLPAMNVLSSPVNCSSTQTTATPITATDSAENANADNDNK